MIFLFHLHRMKTDNQGRTLLPLFRFYAMDNVFNVYQGFWCFFLIIFTYAASCCVTFGRKMSTSSWMGIEDRTFYQILCNLDTLMMVKFVLLELIQYVDWSSYQRLFQEVSHQTSMLGLDWIKLPRIMPYNLYLLLQAFVLIMVIC